MPMVPNMPIEEIIIVGGGLSVSEGLLLGLKSLIKDKCVLGCNYAFKHFDLTALCFTDSGFYKTKDPVRNPDIYEELSHLPLIIGLDKNPRLPIHPNTIIIKQPKTTIINKCPVTGLFALAIAEKLEPKNIFLLGFDWTVEGNTHYYEDTKHRGIGYTKFFKKHNPISYFKYFDNSKSKIYNVSPSSNISNFEKINYKKMFELLSIQTFNQDILRQNIKDLLK